MRRRKARVQDLTEAQWERVLELRCRSKRGELLNDCDRSLLLRAFEQDRSRYASLNVEVFNRTAPFGATTTSRKENV